MDQSLPVGGGWRRQGRYVRMVAAGCRVGVRMMILDIQPLQIITEQENISITQS